ncbi:MAG TPA: translocation/assembly module TamB domain-containing protein [Terriglobales bacterium]|nr:translocation/assembly module TamB domain-containing protein [Terriglobales bacterium]
MRQKQVIRWVGTVVAILVLLAVVASYIVLKTPQFHQYVLANIIEQVQRTTGGKLEIENWEFHFSPMVVNLYGITLHGTEGAEQRPLLQAEKLTVGVSTRGLLRRKLQLTELLVHHPVASLRVDRDGKTNIPIPPENTSSTTSINVWDLAVAHALLSDGDFYYNDNARGFRAEFYDLRTSVRFDPAATRYSGSVSYRDGRLQYANYSPLPHKLEVQFSATPSGIALHPLVYTVGSSRLSVQGEIRNYNNPEFNAGYDILVHTQDFAALSPGAIPTGDVRLVGKCQYASASNQPLLKAILLDGTLDSGLLEIASPAGRIGLRRLKSQYHLADGNLIAPSFAADLLNGRLTGDARIEHLEATAVTKVHASFERISLEAARQSIKRAAVRHIPLTGDLDGKVDASWAGSVKTIRLVSELAMHGIMWDQAANPASSTPTDGRAHLEYDGSRSILELRQTRFEIPSTSVVADGQLSKHSNLRLQAVVGDLNRLMQLVASWRKEFAGSAPPLPAVSGSARLQAVVQGTLEQPAIRGQLNVQNLEVQASQWSSAQLAFEANRSQLAIQNGSLISARQGVLYFGAQVGLKNWTYSPSSPMTANLTARRISLADLEHLADRQYPIVGNLSADLIFQGSQLNPSGHGSIEVVKATAYDEPIQNLGIQFQATGNAVDAKLSLHLPAGSVTAGLNYVPRTKAYQLQLNAPGILLEKLHTVQVKSLPLKGTLAASASGAGTLDDPQLSATIEIPRLDSRQAPISNIQAHMNVAHQHADFTLGSDVAQAHLQAHGTIELRGGYYTEASLDTTKIPLQPLLATYEPSVPEGFEGATELHASFKGPLKDRSHMAIQVTIPLLTASYQGMQIENAEPLRAEYANSVLVLQPGEIRGTDTSLRVQGRIPLEGKGTMSVNVQGSVNLRLLSMFSPDVRGTGTLALDVHSSGNLQNPNMQGQIRIQDVALSSGMTPLGLTSLNGTLDVTMDKLQIRDLTGQMGGGQISVGGSIAYRPSLQFNLVLQDKAVRLLYPAGIRTLLDSNLTFTGTTNSAMLGGRVLITSLNFTPDFDLTNFSSQFNGTSLASSGESFADRVKLHVAVQSRQSLSATSSQLSMEGVANLQVIGTLANPVLVGRTDLTAGELFFRGNRFSLERGMISFDNPNQTRPVLNAQATTTVEQYHLTITVTGPIDKLTTSYMSDPPLSSADIISLLLSGQTTTEAAAAGTPTDALLANRATSQISGGIERLAGISSLTINPLLGANPSARIALQQRVTKNFLFTFSTDVSEPGSEQLQGEYQFNPRWSVRVTGDELGGVAVDGRYHTKF